MRRELGLIRETEVDGDVDAGPGAMGQPLDVVVTVRNAGTTPIVQATVKANLGIVGAGSAFVSQPFSDFDVAPGVQSLAPGAVALVRLPFASGVLRSCGSYSLSVTNKPLLLVCEGGLAGDDAGFDDRFIALNAIDLRLADVALTVAEE